jgi:hypothetical protein
MQELLIVKAVGTYSDHSALKGLEKQEMQHPHSKPSNVYLFKNRSLLCDVLLRSKLLTSFY